MAEINNFFEHINQIHNDEADDVVTVNDSGSEHDISEHDHVEEEKEPAHAQTIDDVETVNIHNELVQSDVVGNINGSLDTQIGGGDENVPPQSTPISKADAAKPTTVAIPLTTASIASTTTTLTAIESLATNSSAMPSSTVAPVVENPPAEVKPVLLERHGGEVLQEIIPAQDVLQEIVQPQKTYDCPYKMCKLQFVKKSAMNKHLRLVHNKQLKKIEAPGKFVRFVPSQKRKRVLVEDDTIDVDTDEDNDNDEYTNDNHDYVIIPNPMIPAMKRYKKNAAKFIFMKQ